MFDDFVYKEFKVKYHSSKGMLCVIYYEIFSPNGTKIGEAYSDSEAKALIDRYTS